MTQPTAAERWAATTTEEFSTSDAFDIMLQASKEDDIDTIEAIAEWLDSN